MTAKDRTPDVEEGIPLQDFSQSEANFSHGQASDDIMENRSSISR